ncbi:MAG: tRNA (guanosine(46)-N7)-methyltransferase TrmB [Myxococcota bacterium]|nr:tRNA (guanosine(46)-N7)-methyltransferase TrmB [Myxococcota bacterium]
MIPPPERLWNDKPLETYGDLDLNPYLKQHRAWGRPVLTADQAAACRGAWHQEFDRSAPLHVEIGTGNGFFFSGMAARHPEWNMVGLEIRFKRVILTAKKLRNEDAEAHARICRYNATALSDLFAPGEIDRLYINHPDPWNKDRWAKNRLLGPEFLDMVATLLKPGAELRLKTDHLVNVEAVTEHMEGRPFSLLGQSGDIGREGTPWEEDLRTNYQRKFDEKGLPVHAVWLRRDGAGEP